MTQQWRKEERRIAKKVKGRRQPRSGGMAGFKSDIKTHEHQAEHKFTAKDSFRVTLRMLKKVDREALQSMREPELIITFSNLDPEILNGDYVLRPYNGEDICRGYTTYHRSFLITESVISSVFVEHDINSELVITFKNLEHGYPKEWILQLLKTSEEQRHWLKKTRIIKEKA